MQVSPQSIPAGVLMTLPEQLPADRRYNPLALNPYVLFNAMPQARNYTETELIRAMDLLLQCNRRLVSSGLDEALLLQQTLVQIVGTRAVEGGGSDARRAILEPRFSTK